MSRLLREYSHHRGPAGHSGHINPASLLAVLQDVGVRLSLRSRLLLIPTTLALASKNTEGARAGQGRFLLEGQLSLSPISFQHSLISLCPHS